jgi:hypothetical protein
MNDTLPATFDADDPMLRLAVAAHLARYKGWTRAQSIRSRRAPAPLDGDVFLASPTSTERPAPLRERVLLQVATRGARHRPDLSMGVTATTDCN